MIASTVGSGESWISAPIDESTCFAGSRFGKTESATATRYRIVGSGQWAAGSGQEQSPRDCRLPSADCRLFHGLFHVLHAREDHRAVRADEHVLLEAGRHFQI